MARSEPEGHVVACHTLEEWNDEMRKGNDNNNQIVVDFTASWCGPCRIISPLFAEMAKKMPHVTFLKVDIDELQSVAADWAVEAMPTFIFLKQGKILDRIVGAKKKSFSKLSQSTPAQLIPRDSAGWVAPQQRERFHPSLVFNLTATAFPGQHHTPWSSSCSYK